MSATAEVRRTDRGLRVRRRLPAPPAVVFDTFGNVDDLMAWWGPPEYPMVECTLDFRPGGVWHYRLHGVRTGRDVWARSVYREIEPPRRLSYLETASDAAGRITDDRPAADVVVTLDAEGDDTLLTIDIRHSTLLERDRAIRLGIERGLAAALDLLDGLLRRRAADSKENDHAHRDVD